MRLYQSYSTSNLDLYCGNCSTSLCSSSFWLVKLTSSRAIDSLVLSSCWMSFCGCKILRYVEKQLMYMYIKHRNVENGLVLILSSFILHKCMVHDAPPESCFISVPILMRGSDNYCFLMRSTCYYTDLVSNWLTVASASVNQYLTWYL